MSRARIALLAAALVAILTTVAFWHISSVVQAGGARTAEAVVTRAQLAFPKLEVLRGLELTNDTNKMAREDEFSQALAKSGDDQRQAVFVALQTRNARLEQKGRKADLLAVVGASGKVISRDLNINAMVDEDLKSKYAAVAKALEGVAVKDVWNFDGHMYHVGVAPIRSAAGQIAGALIVGYSASSTDAQADKDRTGAEVAYILDKKVHASSWKRQGGESAEEKALSAALVEPQGGVKVADAIAAGEVTKIFPIKLNGEDYLATAGPLPGNLTPSAKTAAGFVVLSSVSAARAPFAGLAWWVLLLGGVALLASVGGAVMTAMRFLVALDGIERGVAEVINGNHDYTFEAPNPDTEGLANGLNVMIARLTGRPDPTDEEGGSTGGQAGDRWGGELAVADATGSQLTPENQALANEPEDQYLNRVFAEYQAARKQTGEGVEGLTFDSFVAKLRQNEAQLKQKFNCRAVRFKVAVKDNATTLKPVPLP